MGFRIWLRGKLDALQKRGDALKMAENHRHIAKLDRAIGEQRERLNEAMAEYRRMTAEAAEHPDADPLQVKRYEESVTGHIRAMERNIEILKQAQALLGKPKKE